MQTIYIKNMVCNRCIAAVRQTLARHCSETVEVELGKATLASKLSDKHFLDVCKELEDLGFEVLDDRRQRTVEQVKTEIIKLIYNDDNHSRVNLSEYLQSRLNRDYSSLSKIFSEESSKTIERYYIEQKIERVKELISYGELTLSQIADKMSYSSVAYLSSQFKAVAGMSPSAFKKQQDINRKKLDEL